MKTIISIIILIAIACLCGLTGHQTGFKDGYTQRSIEYIQAKEWDAGKLQEWQQEYRRVASERDYWKAAYWHINKHNGYVER